MSDVVYCEDCKAPIGGESFSTHHMDTICSECFGHYSRCHECDELFYHEDLKDWAHAQLCETCYSLYEKGEDDE